MSLLKKLAGLAVGAAAVGAAVYVLQKREHGEEYEHIVGPEDEVETDAAEPEDDASAEAEQPMPYISRLWPLIRCRRVMIPPTPTR